MKSIGAVVDFARQANDYAERLAGHGIGLYYHNHHIEFAKFDGRYMLDPATWRAAGWSTATRIPGAPRRR